MADTTRRRGATLLEVAVTAFLLALITPPLFGLLQTSSQGVRRTSARRPGPWSGRS